MLSSKISFIKSRKSKNQKAWCLDTRSILVGGRRQFFNTQEEAEKHFRKISTVIESNSDQSWKWTLGQLSAEYLKHIDRKRREGVISNTSYLDKNRHISEFLTFMCFGKTKLVKNLKTLELTHGMVCSEIVDQLKNSGKSKKTIQNCLGSLSQLMAFAKLKDIRPDNPFAGVLNNREAGIKRKLSEVPKASLISPEKIEKIISKMTDEWKIYTTFACQTGVRQGEQRCLTWADIDFVAGKVVVNKAVKHSTVKVGLPKSDAGVRKVPLTKELIKKLKELYLERGRPDPNQLVFCSKAGTLRMPSKFLRAIQRACDAAKVERIRWHDLRHYYASMMLKHYPDDLWRVSRYLGHEKIETTQTIYGHWLESETDDVETHEKVSAIFS